MRHSARLTVLWSLPHHVHLVVDGLADADALERLEHVLVLLARAEARHVTVDLARLDGHDAAVLEMLTASWQRLTQRGGRLHVVGLRRRLATTPEVAAFPARHGAAARAALRPA